MCNNNAESAQLYIPGFKAWQNHFERKLRDSGQKDFKQSAFQSQPKTTAAAASEKALEDQQPFNYVFPSQKTVEQAVIAMKNTDTPVYKFKKSSQRKTKRQNKSGKGRGLKSSSNKRKTANKTFRFRKLEDIFSKKSAN